MTERIAVICGGKSREAAVSRRSGTGVYNALTRLGYTAFLWDPITSITELPPCDTAFIALHGPGGEDGHIQGFFETQGINYTGSGVLACSITMDKAMTKRLLATHHLPVPATYTASDFSAITAPVVIKPCTEGSSFGVHIIHDCNRIPAVYDAVCNTYGTALVEAYITGHDITVSVISLANKLTVLPILALHPREAPFYNYDAKYTPGATEFIIPAPLPPDVYRYCEDLALAAFQATQCRGFARIDMRITPDYRPYILEINTVPGLTETSDLPAQAAAYGINYDALIQAMLDASHAHQV